MSVRHLLLACLMSAVLANSLHFLSESKEHTRVGQPLESHQQSKVKKDINYLYLPKIDPKSYLGDTTPSPRIMRYLPLLNKDGEIDTYHSDIKQVQIKYLKELNYDKAADPAKITQLLAFFNTQLGQSVITYFDTLAKGGLNYYQLSTPHFRKWLATKIVAADNVKMYARTIAEDSELFKQFYTQARNRKISEVNGVPEATQAVQSKKKIKDRPLALPKNSPQTNSQPIKKANKESKTKQSSSLKQSNDKKAQLAGKESVKQVKTDKPQPALNPVSSSRPDTKVDSSNQKQVIKELISSKNTKNTQNVQAKSTLTNAQPTTQKPLKLATKTNQIDQKRKIELGKSIKQQPKPNKQTQISTKDTKQTQISPKPIKMTQTQTKAAKQVKVATKINDQNQNKPKTQTNPSKKVSLGNQKNEKPIQLPKESKKQTVVKTQLTPVNKPVVEKKPAPIATNPKNDKNSQPPKSQVQQTNTKIAKQNKIAQNASPANNQPNNSKTQKDLSQKPITKK